MVTRQLDWRSLTIGLLLGVCAMLALGQAAANDRRDQAFQITAASEPRAGGAPQTSVYVLVHRTGQVIEYRRGNDNQWQRTPAFQISG
jgi:hypothetical protein